MIKINVPATSANVAVGFDSVGIALSLMNTYEFKMQDSFVLKNFDSSISKQENLVLSAYKAFAVSNNETVIPVSIEETKQEIPIGKGLGSSAAALLAGVVASNEIHGINKSLYECASFAANLEGHPDNVFAAAYGMLTAVFLDNYKYHFDTFDVSNDIRFTLLIPASTGSTKTLRNVLPRDVALDDAVFSISRMIHLPKAFQDGDMLSLKRILQDKLHQPYRFEFVPSNEDIKALNNDESTIAVISGSGPSVLVISNKEVSFNKSIQESFFIHPVTLSKGITKEELE